MTPELIQQIEQEAKAYADVQDADIEGQKHLRRKTLVRYAHQDAATKYATLWQASEQRVKELERALEKIAKWELPNTGQFWDEEKTQPMSFGACYGSNGERDYMRSLATNTLSLTQPPNNGE